MSDTRINFKEDDSIEQSIRTLTDGKDAVDILKNFPIYVRNPWLKVFLAHYELFRQTIELPGDIVELGVFRGRSMMSFARFLEIHCMGDRQKRVWGFDNWEGLPELRPEDGKAQGGKWVGAYNAGDYLEELRDAIRIFDLDRLAPQKERVMLIKGDIGEILPKFVEDHPGMRISLLHFDCDLYKPTLEGLKHLYPLVVPGGIILFDEYGLIPWEGECKAVDEYFHGKQELKRFTWSSNPAGWFKK